MRSSFVSALTLHAIGNGRSALCARAGEVTATLTASVASVKTCLMGPTSRQEWAWMIHHIPFLIGNTHAILR
jgi:hypothetical protein